VRTDEIEMHPRQQVAVLDLDEVKIMSAHGQAVLNLTP